MDKITKDFFTLKNENMFATKIQNENDIPKTNQILTKNNEGEKTMNTENVKLNETISADDIGKRIELAGRKISDIQAINFNKYAVDLYKTDGMVMDIENDRELFDSENKINYDVYTMMLEDGKKTLTQPMKCIMEGEGYLVFAMFSDKSDGKREIVIRLAFSEDEITDEISIKQSNFCKMINHLRVAKEDKSTKVTAEQRIYEKFRDDILDYQRSGASLNAFEIIKSIFNNYDELPQRRNNVDLDTLGEVYDKLYKYMTTRESYGSDYMRIQKEGKYFKIFPADFEVIAKNVGMSEIKLARFLADRGLLNIPKYSAGYQTKIHIPYKKDEAPIKRWAYCVLKAEYFTKQLRYDLGINEEEANIG